MNDYSSRSHSILTVYITSEQAVSINYDIFHGSHTCNFLEEDNKKKSSIKYTRDDNCVNIVAIKVNFISFNFPVPFLCPRDQELCNSYRKEQ